MSILVVLACVVSTEARSQTIETARSIRVTVIASNSKKPLAGATVCIENDSTELHSGETSEAGHFDSKPIALDIKKIRVVVSLPKKQSVYKDVAREDKVMIELSDRDLRPAKPCTETRTYEYWVQIRKRRFERREYTVTYYVPCRPQPIHPIGSQLADHNRRSAPAK